MTVVNIDFRIFILFLFFLQRYYLKSLGTFRCQFFFLQPGFSRRNYRMKITKDSTHWPKGQTQPIVLYASIVTRGILVESVGCFVFVITVDEIYQKKDKQFFFFRNIHTNVCD